VDTGELLDGDRLWRFRGLLAGHQCDLIRSRADSSYVRPALVIIRLVMTLITPTVPPESHTVVIAPAVLLAPIVTSPSARENADELIVSPAANRLVQSNW
jgi:hypothetical protein